MEADLARIVRLREVEPEKIVSFGVGCQIDDLDLVADRDPGPAILNLLARQAGLLQQRAGIDAVEFRARESDARQNAGRTRDYLVTAGTLLGHDDLNGLARGDKPLAQNNKTEPKSRSYLTAVSAWISRRGGRLHEPRNRKSMATRQKVIAIVDHELGVRKAAEAVLTGHGYRTELYASAEQFILAVATTKADCLVIDAGLRDITGIELARHLQASGLHIPIVFTGVSGDAVRRQAIELGSVAILDKPVAAQQLIEAVATATGSNPHFDK